MKLFNHSIKFSTPHFSGFNPIPRENGTTGLHQTTETRFSAKDSRRSQKPGWETHNLAFYTAFDEAVNNYYDFKKGTRPSHPAIANKLKQAKLMIIQRLVLDTVKKTRTPESILSKHEQKALSTKDWQKLIIPKAERKLPAKQRGEYSETALLNQIFSKVVQNADEYAAPIIARFLIEMGADVNYEYKALNDWDGTPDYTVIPAVEAVRQKNMPLLLTLLQTGQVNWEAQDVAGRSLKKLVNELPIQVGSRTEKIKTLEAQIATLKQEIQFLNLLGEVQQTPPSDTKAE